VLVLKLGPQLGLLCGGSFTGYSHQGSNEAIGVIEFADAAEPPDADDRTNDQTSH